MPAVMIERIAAFADGLNISVPLLRELARFQAIIQIDCRQRWPARTL
jgi:hypothetical protein